MNVITYKPIGIIRSPYKNIEGTPIQPTGSQGVVGSIELERDYAPGLKDLEGFSHIVLLYHFHLSSGFSLEVKPFLDDQMHGVFATRAPKRPNSIGLSIVRLTGIEGHLLHIEDVDVIDGTPLLDIKPYVPEFDVRQVQKTGWLEKKARHAKEVRADERFR
jgi:tRNA (adenine37-N6)-methyltransferase